MSLKTGSSSLRVLSRVCNLCLSRSYSRSRTPMNSVCLSSKKVKSTGNSGNQQWHHNKTITSISESCFSTTSSSIKSGKSTVEQTITDNANPTGKEVEPSTEFLESQTRRIIVDPSSVKQVYYFDSLTFVKRLESSGFTRSQAEGLTECFTDIIHSTLDHQTRHFITKPQQEILVQQLLAEINGIKKDMLILQKSEFTALQHDTEKQSLELKMVKDSMEDEIQKIKGKITLDINLERGRAIEAHADSEKELNKLHNKIDTGMANLRTMFEKYRNDVFKYAGGTILTCASISLGIVRIMS